MTIDFYTKKCLNCNQFSVFKNLKTSLIYASKGGQWDYSHYYSLRKKRIVGSQTYH